MHIIVSGKKQQEYRIYFMFGRKPKFTVNILFRLESNTTSANLTQYV